jgi:hypothetical protein
MSDPKDKTRYNPPEKTEMPEYDYQELDNRTYSVSCKNEKPEKKSEQLTSLSHLCL